MKQEPSGPSFLLPIRKSDSISQAERSFSQIWLANHNLPGNQLLFHYTDKAGFEGIVDSRSIWFGHHDSFNDPLEIQYGRDLIMEEISDEMHVHDSDEAQYFLRGLMGHVRSFAELQFHAFIACFCQRPNLLSQWNAYGYRGGGFTLGFAFNSDTRIAHSINETDEGWQPILRRVIYDERKQRELVRTYLDLLTEQFPAHFEDFPLDEPHTSVGSMQASNRLFDMMLSFKHRAFQVEEEWRLIRVGAEDERPDTLKFRDSAGYFVPYRSTPIYENDRKTGEPTFPLRYVGIGPSLEPRRTTSAISLYLRSAAAGAHPVRFPNSYIEIVAPDFRLRRRPMA